MVRIYPCRIEGGGERGNLGSPLYIVSTFNKGGHGNLL
jgi:hypothetical protein